ncbi:MAG: hypothetical protein GF334_09245 [Candidatus Altiarchaeales archaeon]|nr:hypothetical protein [Candidatus Altiarchaeales archaeon]
MHKVHIRDLNFFSEKYPDRPNSYFKWVWDRQPQDNDITVFTDKFLHEAKSNKSRIKVAWILEPPVIDPKVYALIKSEYQHFDMIFTYCENLLPISKKFRYLPYGTTWVHEGQRGIPKAKSSLINTIVSQKRIVEGHKLRHAIVDRYGDRMVVLGHGYRPIPNKFVGLADFMYSITVENCRVNSYFSEKLLDCFLTGTVPIYWGFPKVSALFDPEGVITFTSIDEIEGILKGLSKEDYSRRSNAIHKNYQTALEYIDLEKWLWRNGLRSFCE